MDEPHRGEEASWTTHAAPSRSGRSVTWSRRSPTSTRPPGQGDEGAPDAIVVIEPAYADAVGELRAGDEIVVLTWLDRADRSVLMTHPRDDRGRRPIGVFSTRSPHRPNPIGLHTVSVVAVDGPRLRVRHLEAIDGTPVLDVKPVLGPVGDR